MNKLAPLLLQITFYCLLLVIGVSTVCAQVPAIFFTDITSGPSTGGENAAGAYVTVYGNFFGTTAGSVKIGSVNATTIKQWGTPSLWYQKVTFQIPSSVGLGATTLQITTPAGTSNTVPFTVRKGNIYCVSTTGSDSNSGRFPSCWRTVLQAKSSMVAGDISYLENGVTQTAVDNYNASLSITTGGTAAAPVALVAYPGATATIGTDSMTFAARTPAVSGTMDYWVLAGLTMRGQAALDLLGNTGWRVIDNDMSCPQGSGQSACLHADTNVNLYVYGNHVHNVGDQAGSIDKYFHAVYFTTNTNHVWVGWNEVAPNPTHSTTSGGCRAIQFYSTGGSDQFDLHVYNNLVHDAICDGINFATVDPSKGTVEAYNNVVYHVGTGPDPANGSSNYSCVLAGSSGNPSVSVQIYNNTFYDCGSRKTTDAGAIAPDTPVQTRNNIVYELSGESYINPSSGNSGLTGSDNIWYGSSGTPSATTGNITSNPLLKDVANADFGLMTGSPAIGHGVNTGLTDDFEGMPRNPSAMDIGARAVGGSTLVTKSACDLNQDGVVNATDIALEAAQDLGLTPCTNGDINKDGLCTVVDLQRVINASFGQACKVTP
ncbi:MAG: hypothetical protein HIU93_15815 [Acidobacteria bacterium]|nr:hypothetical protein [Acidobacteriota bacterium]